MILGLTKKIVVLDTETGSDVDITRRGMYLYWADPSTKVFMVSAKDHLDTKPARVWDFEGRGERVPQRLVDLSQLPPEECMFAAANSEFDRAALEWLGLPTPPEKWIDVLVCAYILGFSGRLKDVLSQTNLGRKDPMGSKAITKFSKQMSPWTDDPQLWDHFRVYCGIDTDVETDLLNFCLRYLDSDWMRPVTQHIFRQEIIYRKINLRGIPTDMETVNGAVRIIDAEKGRLAEEMREISGLENPNSNTQLREWLHANGSHINGVAKEAVRDEILIQKDLIKLETDVPEEKRRRMIQMLELRQAINKTSTDKYFAMQRTNCAWDDRIRGGWQFYGASRTGRIAGRILNPANIARPMLKDPNAAIPFLARGERDLLALCYPGQSVLDTLSWCVRASLKAPEGMLWCVADLTSIESVGSAWLAGCDRMLDIFFTGHDTYKTYAAQYYGIDYDKVTKEQRTYSKPVVLGATYRMSGGGLVGYAAGMGIELEVEEGEKQVAMFREIYHEIVHYWKQLNDAAIAAVDHPGQEFHANAVAGVEQEYIDERGKLQRVYRYKSWPRVTYWSNGEFLFCRLPSGRYLCYHSPSIEPHTVTPVDPEKDPFTISRALHYMGNNQKATGAKWQKLSVHGGHLLENVCQAMCRDAMWHGLEGAEYDDDLIVVGDVYDEVMALAREDDATALDRLLGYLTTRAPWMDERFFLGADGYMETRYKK